MNRNPEHNYSGRYRPFFPFYNLENSVPSSHPQPNQAAASIDPRVLMQVPVQMYPFVFPHYQLIFRLISPFRVMPNISTMPGNFVAPRSGMNPYQPLASVQLMKSNYSHAEEPEESFKRRCVYDTFWFPFLLLNDDISPDYFPQHQGDIFPQLTCIQPIAPAMPKPDYHLMHS